MSSMLKDLDLISLQEVRSKVEKAYAAWPSKAYLVDNRGEILFSTRLGEQDFHAAEFEAALRKLATPVKESPLPRGAQ